MIKGALAKNVANVALTLSDLVQHHGTLTARAILL